MKRRFKILTLLLLCSCTVFLKTPFAQKNNRTSTNAATPIDDAALRNADARAGEWITHGRTYAETRFSPLNKVNAGNIKNLGLAWSFDTETTRGLEATPIVAGGVMYTTGSWSVVFAIDARTGKVAGRLDVRGWCCDRSPIA